MADKTPEQLAEEAQERARAANAEHNQTRLQRLEQIADGNDKLAAGEMTEGADGNLQLDTPEHREAAAAREEEESQRFLAEQEARALQTEGAEPERDSAQASAPTHDTPDTKVINGATHYLTVVNGKEKWLTLEQLRGAAQKVESADEYLAAASASVRQAAGLALQQPTQSDPAAASRATWKKIVLDSAMGDERAAEHLAAALAERPALSHEQLRQIEERASFVQAAKQFRHDYADLWGDAHLRRIVTERDSELARENPQMDFTERLEQAGNDVREWKQRLTGGAPVRAAASPNKLAAKKTLVNVPSAAARQAAPVDEDSEESVETVIQRMAQARGQARPITHPGRRAT